jgi:hypothetical protein
MSWFGAPTVLQIDPPARGARRPPPRTRFKAASGATAVRYMSARSRLQGGRMHGRARTARVGAVMPTVLPGIWTLNCHFRMSTRCRRPPLILVTGTWLGILDAEDDGGAPESRSIGERVARQNQTDSRMAASSAGRDSGAKWDASTCTTRSAAAIFCWSAGKIPGRGRRRRTWPDTRAGAWQACRTPPRSAAAVARTTRRTTHRQSAARVPRMTAASSTTWSTPSARAVSHSTLCSDLMSSSVWPRRGRNPEM